MFLAKQLHEVLVLAREQFNLDVIQGYLAGPSVDFQGCVGPTGSFRYDSLSVLSSTARNLFVLTALKVRRRGHCRRRTEDHRDVGGTTFLPGGFFHRKSVAMTISKASVSSTLQCCITDSSPSRIDTSTTPREWMVCPSPTPMATVLVFLKVFSRRRATIESVAPVSSTARKI